MRNKRFLVINLLYLLVGALSARYYGWQLIVILLLFGWAMNIENSPGKLR